MRKWLQNFRESLSLDSGRNRERKAISTGRLGELLHNIHRELAASRPETDPPDDLHFSIMRAVRASSTVAAKRCSVVGGFQRRLRMAGAGICALLLIAGLVATLRHRSGSSETQNFAAAQPAFALAAQASVQLNALNGLDQELQHTDLDLRSAAAHLLASVP